MRQIAGASCSLAPRQLGDVVAGVAAARISAKVIFCWRVILMYPSPVPSLDARRCAVRLFRASQ